MLPSIIDFRGRYHQDHRQRGGNKGVTDRHSSMKICLLKRELCYVGMCFSSILIDNSQKSFAEKHTQTNPPIDPYINCLVEGSI